MRKKLFLILAFIIIPLNGLAAQETIKDIIKQLRDKNLRVRIKAMEKLVDWGPERKKAIPKLIKMIKNKNKKLLSLRVPAIKTLGYIGSKKDLSALEDVFEDKDENVRYYARAAWSRISKKPFPVSVVKDSIYESRLNETKRKKLLKKFQAHPGTEEAILAGLTWLKNHQHPSGCWTSSHGTQCKGQICSGNADSGITNGLTGLAILAFLGAGHTSKDSAAFKTQIEKGILYLQAQQKPDGFLGKTSIAGKPDNDRYGIYNHAIATMALAEAFGMGETTPKLKEQIQLAVDYLVNAQNPNSAWHYTSKSGQNDTSITTWILMALRSARGIPGIQVPSECFIGAENWYDQATDDSYYRCGYMQRGCSARCKGTKKKPVFSKLSVTYNTYQCCTPSHNMNKKFGKIFSESEAMTAAAIIGRVLLGQIPSKTAPIKGGAQILSQTLPSYEVGGGKVENKIDYYYWHFGTLAMFQIGGDYWKFWNRKLKAALIESQNKEGCTAGSWEPVSVWSHVAGRVFSTSINVLTLETYYRFPQYYKPEKK